MRVAVRGVPPSLEMIVTFASVAIAAVVIGNVAVLLPAGTVTVAGTDAREPLEEVSETA